jgi:hypothetical protein
MTRFKNIFRNIDYHLSAIERQDADKNHTLDYYSNGRGAMTDFSLNAISQK